MYVWIKGVSFLCGCLNAAYQKFVNGHSNPNPSSLVLKPQRDRGPSLSLCCAMDIRAMHSRNPWIPLYAQRSLNRHIFKRNIRSTFENYSCVKYFHDQTTSLKMSCYIPKDTLLLCFNLKAISQIQYRKNMYYGSFRGLISILLLIIYFG